MIFKKKEGKKEGWVSILSTSSRTSFLFSSGHKKGGEAVRQCVSRRLSWQVMGKEGGHDKRRGRAKRGA